MPIQSMQDLMLEELRELYSAERIALQAYPRLRKAMQTESLQDAVERHVEQTREQVERLGRVFELMDAKTRGKTCHAMQGLVEEARGHMDADLAPELLEVMLVADMQKIEHFEIAAYGSARAHAEALGLDQAVALLDETLNEEKETDALLNRLATEEINPRAMADADEGEEESEEEEGDGRSTRTRGTRGQRAARGVSR
jgi:ferritin-like metal-binding protein YciE